MAISKECYEKFREEIFHLLNAEGNLLEEDEIMLRIISESDSPRDVLELAKEMKEEGNALFKKGNFIDALEKYGYAGMIITCYLFEEEFRQEFFELAINILLNAAACFTKKREFETVGLVCSVILEFHPKQVKALFRRGMAALELGRRDLAFWDLYQASLIEPSNKEIQKNLKNLKSRNNQKDRDGQKRCSAPIGLGLGVPPLKRRGKECPANKSNNVECNRGIKEGKDETICCSTDYTQLKQVDGVNREEMTTEDMIEDCVSELSVVESNHSCMDASSEGDSCVEQKDPPVSEEVSVQEFVEEDDSNSSSLKNKNQAGSKYRFVNRRKADSRLTIYEKGYHKLRSGRHLQYVDSKTGMFMTVRMVPWTREKANKQEEPKNKSVEVMEQPVEVAEILDEEKSTVTQEKQVMEQPVESGMIEEFVEISRAVTPMEVNKDDWVVMSERAQFSSAFPKRGRTKYSVNKTKKRIANPQTLYGAGKREAQRRSNKLFCRNRSSAKKRNHAWTLTESYEKAKKKLKTNGCLSASISEVSYDNTSVDYVYYSNNVYVNSYVESCNFSGLPATHELALAKSHGE